MKNKERFNEWMLKIKNNHYHDNEKMLNAFNKIEDEEDKKDFIIENLISELDSVREKLKKAYEFMEDLAKEMEVEYEQVK